MKDDNSISGSNANGQYATSKSPDHIPSTMEMPNTFFKDDTIRSKVLCEDCCSNKALPEHNSTWGDFESFSESNPESEILYYTVEELSGTLKCDFSPTSTCISTTSKEADCSEQTAFPIGWDFHIPEALDTKSCEDIFKLSFPDKPTEQSTGAVKSLHKPPASSNEESILGEFMKTRLWLGGANIERCQDVSAATPGCEWSKSMCCKNLMLLLGIDACQKEFSENGEEKDAIISKDTKAIPVNYSLYPAVNKALIQTKVILLFSVRVTVFLLDTLRSGQCYLMEEWLLFSLR
ncbi:hypothetical protein FKM82_016964 [Ascaphus truei]